MGCSANVADDRCVGNSGADAGGATHTLTACPTGTGGAAYGCPELQSLYANCTATHMASDVRFLSMLLVIDKSSSMNEPHPSGNGLSKWDTMRSALGAVLTRIEGGSSDVNPEFSLGVELFPWLATGGAPSEACAVVSGQSAIAVPIEVGQKQLLEVFDAINSQTPGGYSPTAEALRQALDYFTNGDGRCIRGKLLLLVTNGRANCNPALSCTADSCTVNANGTCSAGDNCCDDAGYLCNDQDAVVAAIGALARAGIQTLVVGMPGSDADAAALNAYANAGKMPNSNSTTNDIYYPIQDATGAPDLEVALGWTIPQILKTCEVVLGSTPASPDQTHVFLNCMPVFQTQLNDGSGWYMDFDYSPPHLVFAGDACNTLMATVGVRPMTLDVYTDCPSP